MSAGVAQLVEHRFCKPVVVGSSPITSSTFFEARLPSGQRQQTVNLPGFPFDGSNPSLATTLSGCSSVGRVPAFQAGCRAFESRRPLHFLLNK